MRVNKTKKEVLDLMEVLTNSQTTLFPCSVELFRIDIVVFFLRKKVKKFYLLFSLLTIISLNGKLLGILRDSIILNLEGSDAVVVPFIKIWFVLPASFIFLRIYNF